MPVMDGFQALEQMKADEKLKHIPVVVATAKNEDASEVKAFMMGAGDYVSKPYKPLIIRQRVRNIINLHESAITVDELQIDVLTGLYNRYAFLQKAEKMIVEKEPGYYIMACLDINNFKMINDQYGTVKGDEVLRFVAGIAKPAFMQMEGISGRMMADNFSALYPAKYAQSEELRKCEESVAAFDGSIRPLSFSIGRYVVDDLSLSVSTMYDRAVTACSTVKGRFNTNVAYFNDSMKDAEMAEQQIVSEMGTALEEGQFEPWFQPQYNHNTGALIGAEALVRWRHPERGILSPGTFVHIFERNGFIYELDKYIWEQVCADMRRWMDQGGEVLPVSVNISRYDVYKEDLIPTISDLVSKYGISVDLLRLEITESAFAIDDKKIIDIVQELVDMGFTVEIDDFGSGYSSLNTLKDVPAQIIKLDMGFLDSEGDTSRGGDIIESMVRMSKWLDMTIIAEGVETVRQADFLKSIGCFYVQGYLYAKPMAKEDFEELLRDSSKQQKIMAVETVENLDNNEFWDPESMDILIFNSYIGGACVYEYHNDRIELLRANDKYMEVIGSTGMTLDDALKLDWMKHLDQKSRRTILSFLRDNMKTGVEKTLECIFVGLPGCDEKVYLRVTMRVIATAEARCLVYCINQNITEQKISELKRSETIEQLRFLDGVAHQLLGQADADAGVRAILSKMLAFFHGDRSYVLEFDRRQDTVSSTYEVCAHGVAGNKNIVRDLPLPTADFLLQALADKDYVSIEDVSVLDVGARGKEVFQALSIKSLVAIPLKKDGQIIGIVGLNNPAQKADLIGGLSALGDYVTVLITRRELNRVIASDNEEKNAIMDSVPGGLVRMKVQDDDSIEPSYRSEGFMNLVGMKPGVKQEFSYKEDVMEGVHPDDKEYVGNIAAALLRGEHIRDARYRLRHCDGGYVWVMINGNMRKTITGERYLNIFFTSAVAPAYQGNTAEEHVNDMSSEVDLIDTIMTDVREQQSTIEHLRLSEAGYKLAMQNAGNKVCHFMVDERVLIVPPNLAVDCGLPERVENMPDGMIEAGVVPDDSIPKVREFYENIVGGAKNGDQVFQLRLPVGYRWIKAGFSTIFSTGRPVFAIVSHEDITGQMEKEMIYSRWRQSLENRVPESYTLLRCNISKSVTKDIQEGNLLNMDFDENLRNFNGRMKKYAAEHVCEEDRPAYEAIANSAALLGDYYRGIGQKTLDYRECLPDGGTRWLRLTVELMKYPSTADVEAYLTFEDIDKIKREDMDIRLRAETDALTGLLNRVVFAEKMNSTITAADQACQPISSGAAGTTRDINALLVIDIDNFKGLNDSYGHITGDKVLVDVAKSLQDVFRVDDLVGRLGGDEFIVFLCNMPDKSAIAAKAEQFFAELSKPCNYSETLSKTKGISLSASDSEPTAAKGISLSASIGIATAPADGNSFEALYPKADMALYTAKRNGKGCIAFYADVICQ